MNSLIVIVGPTAVGKSALALQLAMRIGGEIVSGDSMCVYSGMDIGTAKPTQEERNLVPHHLIDIKDPTEPFSVVEFQQLASEAINQINQRGNLPILVGGTGLYIQALLEGYQFSPTGKTPLRTTLAASDVADQNGMLTEKLFQQLTELDPISAARIHPHDRKRILRALEVTTTENRPLSSSKATSLQFDCLVFGLSMDRQELYRRIELRVDNMVQQGLLAEVTALLDKGLASDATALQAIGYKEFVACIQQNLSQETAISLIKQSSRRYAKRQLTWFRRMPYLEWIDPSAAGDVESALTTIIRRVAEKFTIK